MSHIEEILLQKIQIKFLSNKHNSYTYELPEGGKRRIRRFGFWVN